MKTELAGQTWHKITKYYKGGMSEFQIAVPKGVRLTKQEWDAIAEVITLAELGYIWRLWRL